MSAVADRYDRNIRLFGADGQRKLRDARVALIGVGGLGSPLAQHLALLGVGGIDLVDMEELDHTNRNRFVGARNSDPVPGSAKVDLSARLIAEIDPSIEVRATRASLVSGDAFDAVKRADWVLGCFDDDGPRSVLNELCAAYRKPYIDLASDVPEAQVYGGRVCVSMDGAGCLSCGGLLDRKAVRRFLTPEGQLAGEDRIYGIDRSALDEKGPSVSPINGVVAGLAATEFMVGVTQMRAPTFLQDYRAHVSKVYSSVAPDPSECLICAGVYGKGSEADVERYLRLPHLS